MANAKNTAESTPTTDVVEIDPQSQDEETSHAGVINVSDILASMNDTTKVVSTIQGDDFDARLSLAAALTTSAPLDDHLNEQINLVDYVITEASFLNEKSGEVETAPRIVLIDENGDAFHAVSIGLLTALRNIRLAFGDMFGTQPVPIKVVRQKGNNGYHFFTINIVK